MDAWGGIIGAMKASGKSKFDLLSISSAHANVLPAGVLQQHVTAIFTLLNLIATDINRSESLMRASMGVIGYVSHQESKTGSESLLTPCQ
jgi:importin subunit beta-1